MEISVQIEGASKVGVFLEAFPKETGKAILRALKRGTTSAATHANRVVSAEMGLKVGDVRKRIRVVEPRGETLTGEVRGSLKRIPLIEFGARGPEPSRGRGGGVSYRIGSGGRGRHPHAFITTVGSHRGVFGRKRIP
ncbi:MAG: phage tail protein, partial [Thermoplasmata archaeon]